MPGLPLLSVYTFIHTRAALAHRTYNVNGADYGARRIDAHDTHIYTRTQRRGGRPGLCWHSQCARALAAQGVGTMCRELRSLFSGGASFSLSLPSIYRGHHTKDVYIYITTKDTTATKDSFDIVSVQRTDDFCLALPLSSPRARCSAMESLESIYEREPVDSLLNDGIWRFRAGRAQSKKIGSERERDICMVIGSK